eukprot:283879_1
MTASINHDEKDASNDKNEFHVVASPTDSDVFICIGPLPQQANWITDYKHCEKVVHIHHQGTGSVETRQCILIDMRATSDIGRKIYKNIFGGPFETVYSCKLTEAQYAIFNDDESKQEDKKLNVDDASNQKYVEFLKLLSYDVGSKQDMMVTKEQEKIEWKKSENDIALQEALIDLKAKKAKLQIYENAACIWV